MLETEFSNKLEKFFDKVTQTKNHKSHTVEFQAELQSLIAEATMMEAANTAIFLEIVLNLLQQDTDPNNQMLVESMISKIEQDLDMWKKPAFKLPEILNFIGIRLLPSAESGSEIDFVKSLFKKAIDLAKNAGNIPVIATSSVNLAQAYRKASEALKAARLFEIAASIDQSDENVADCLAQASVLYYKSGNIEKSLNLVKIAVKYQKKLFRSVNQLLLFQTDLSREFALKYFNDRDRRGQALNYLNEAIQILEEIGNEKELASVYDEAATIHQKLSNFEEAIENHLRARKLAVSCGFHDLFIKSSFKLIVLLMELEKHEKALELIQETKSEVSLGEEVLKNVERLENKIKEWLIKTGTVSQHVKTAEERAAPLEVTRIKVTNEEVSRETRSSEAIMFSGTVADLLEVAEESEEDISSVEMEEKEDIQLLDDVTAAEHSIEDQISLNLSPTRRITQFPADQEQMFDQSSAEADMPTVDQVVESDQDQILQEPEAAPEPAPEPEAAPERVERVSSPRRTYLRSKKRITSFFKKRGYQITYDAVPFGSTSSVDIVAQKGAVRKHKIFLQLAQNPADATISTYILQGISERGLKLIFLLSGDEKDVFVPRDVNIASKTYQLKRFVK